ncbi:hypothetical protein BHE74_00054397 [Ensete ventricosum]|nr:hypothetical protein GW17_00010160 [Ensete ventricosum]RWW40202.1 hypothetical protein BHE74_00054397 [Ensete ventricosum]RZR91229.1 hypothetical protein BHM03_00019320 [Ensete ventricosum]
MQIQNGMGWEVVGLTTASRGGGWHRDESEHSLVGGDQTTVCFRYSLTEPPCTASGYLRGKSHSCNTENYSDCCKDGEMYPQYQCSPPVTSSTPAQMMIVSFAINGDGGGPGACNGQYHNDTEMAVALSTGWFDGGSRCNRNIRISANGRSVLAKVVDECSSVDGCKAEQNYTPPCPNNVVNASPAVWDAMGIPELQRGDYTVTWSDA